MNSDKILFKLHAEMCNSFAHPIRLETVHHLKNKGSELSFGEIADLIGVGKSTLARHLSIMVTNGILIQRKEGVNVFYKISETMPLFVKAYAGVTDQQIASANDSLTNYFSAMQNMVADPGLSIENNKWNIIPTKHVSDNLADYPTSAWFDKVDYRGAVDPNNNWIEGWTLFSKKYLTK